MPVAVPNLHPGVVAPLVGPHRGAHGAGWNTHRATGFDENDGQPGARGFAEGLGFLEALIGALASGVVVDVDQLEELSVEGLGRFAGRAGVLHQIPGQCQQLGTPWIPGFIKHRIGQHIIQEDGLGHCCRPRKLLPGAQGQIQVLQKELVAEIPAIRLGHVFRQKAGGPFASSAMPIPGCLDEVRNRGTPTRPPEREHQENQTNHRHGGTLQQLHSPGQSTSHTTASPKLSPPAPNPGKDFPSTRKTFCWPDFQGGFHRQKSRGKPSIVKTGTRHGSDRSGCSSTEPLPHVDGCHNEGTGFQHRGPPHPVPALLQVPRPGRPITQGQPAPRCA